MIFRKGFHFKNQSTKYSKKLALCAAYSLSINDRVACK